MPRRIRPEAYLVHCFRRHMGQDGDGDPADFFLWLDDHLPVPGVGVRVEVWRRSKIPPAWVARHNRGRGVPDRCADEDADAADAPAIVARWEGPAVSYLRRAVIERVFWDKVWRGTTEASGATALATTVTSMAAFSEHVPDSLVIRDERVTAARRFVVAQVPRAGTHDVARTQAIGNRRFDIAGVIYHFGSAAGGHYVCSLRCGAGGEWWIMDDLRSGAPQRWDPPTWHHDATDADAVTAWPHVLLYSLAGEPWPAPPDANLVNGTGHDCFGNALLQLLRAVVAPEARVRPFVRALAVTLHERKSCAATENTTWTGSSGSSRSASAAAPAAPTPTASSRSTTVP